MNHGDVRKWAIEVFKEALDKIVESKNSRRVPYYILATVEDGYAGPPAYGNSNEILGNVARASDTINMEGKKVARNRFMILEESGLPPIPLIGSSLFKIDNIRGKVDCIYALPPDMPRMENFEVGDSNSEFVHNCAEGMPIAY